VPQEKTHRLRRLGHGVLDHPLYIVLVAAVVVFTMWVIGTRSEPYIVKAAFTSGFNLVPGLPVDIDGQQVGMIAGVKYDASVAGGEAIVSIGISNASFIPLHRGTTVEARWGSTIGNGTRRLDVNPGPQSAPRIPNQGIIETNDTLPAQDIDQQLNILNSRTRPQLIKLLGNLEHGIHGQALYLHAGINSSPAALNAANGVLGDLNADTYALKSLIASGSSLTSVLAARAQGISNLVTVAGQTFATISQHANGLQQSITNLPGALTEARGTLVRLDTSVGILHGLIADIRPGAAQLAPLATALDPTLATLRNLVPTGVSTLRTATAAAPAISQMLKVATPFMPKVTSVTAQLAPMVACVRPYAPEAGSAVESAAGWNETYILQKPTEGITSYYGAPQGPYVESHGVRAMPEASFASVHAYPPGMSTQAFLSLSGKQYALPRPPGLGAGTPWFQPSCQAGVNALNPNADPENPIK
jgi:ABC-type transporter Mla subunit MlaD